MRAALPSIYTWCIPFSLRIGKGYASGKGGDLPRYTETPPTSFRKPFKSRSGAHQVVPLSFTILEKLARDDAGEGMRCRIERRGTAIVVAEEPGCGRDAVLFQGCLKDCVREEGNEFGYGFGMTCCGGGFRFSLASREALRHGRRIKPEPPFLCRSFDPPTSKPVSPNVPFRSSGFIARALAIIRCC